MKKIRLDKKVEIPILGLGTWQLNDKYCQEAVEVALVTGYRHIDTAQYYDNHSDIKLAFKHSLLKKDDVFVTSKLWLDNQSQDKVVPSIEKSLEELGMDYLDLCLIHWPNPNIPFEETLEQLQIARQKGFIKAYGVSNFTIRHLKLCRQKGFKIINNQVEFHPSFNQKELKNYCDLFGITITAYSPLGQGQDLKIALIKTLADKYQASPSQIILNWLISQNIVVIPKATNPKNIIDNFQCLNWQMEKMDIEAINKLSGQKRLINPSFAQFED
jgi:diketogulonate reductase-like aldo/keto reductase